MRRIAIDTNIYTSFKCNDGSVVEAFREGRPISTNDISIAANAMKHGLALYSLESDFGEIEPLLILSQIKEQMDRFKDQAGN
jgi:hypothetical protein